MRKAEQLKKAWPVLLEEARNSPITISYRGVNEKDEPLYEIVNRKGIFICLLSTEKQILESLIKGG